MIVGIDIGNTTVEFGIIRGEEIVSFKFASDRDKTVDDWLINIDFVVKDEKPMDILISSVVPPIEEKVEKAFLKYFGKSPLIIGRDVKIPIKINYENEKEVGIDRLVNAYAGLKLFKPPFIVIDLGTAITFDVVNEKGEYDGGMIFPGMETSIDTLFSKTAKLPKVKLEKPKILIGKNTVGSIQSGIYYGYISLIEGMVEKISAYYKFNFSIILTGGHSYLISSGLNIKHKVVEKLSMLGIKFLAEEML
ncbi:MAG: type III pantothenate kinase [Hydrogenothermaceae bacterium]|nr:type III pantothenate kinase [Hydrogenothermaceae bacterium]